MVTPDDLAALVTEARNPRSEALDALSTLQMMALMNDEDATVAAVVHGQLPAIAAAVDAIEARLARGGRLIYCGAGTSGRLGVLDAVECGPTFAAPPGQVVGLIAGGPGAFVQAVEGAEDDEGLGARDVAALQAGPKDAVVGIAASGRTPYVIGALRAARAVGAFTAAVVCNPRGPVAAAAELAIEVVVGPEVLTGSTRLKAGTATKMVLNMLSTGAFVRRHKTYGNLMVDLQATNRKLVARSRRIVAEATGCDAATAAAVLDRCGGSVKAAIVALRTGLDPAAAALRLQSAEGSVRTALAQR